MVGEDTFYERATARDDRYSALVRQVAVEDGGWMLGFVGWLRAEANMRSASIVAAAEAVHARLADPVRTRVSDQVFDETVNRSLVAAALQRADEPGEMLAYWTSRFGRAIPKPVKRGVGDAVRQLYTERSLLKYDTGSHGFRFGDVLDLVHPAPSAGKAWQGDLFKVALDRRHNRENTGFPGTLGVLLANLQLHLDARQDPAVLLQPGRLAEAGWTWEDGLSFAGSKLDKAKLWEALIPSMGYMACLRNLRNFDEAGVSDAVAATVAARLADPAEVAKSRQLPMRFLSAYRAAPSLRWAYPLERALGYCLANIPELPGRTLILVDTSSSMDEAFSKDGTVKRWDAAVVFGVALGQRCSSPDVVSFSSTARIWGDAHNAHTKAFGLQRGESLLRAAERWKADGYFLGGGTATAAALRKHYAGHARVVIVTDEQAASDWQEVGDSAPVNIPMYTWNLAGLEKGHTPSGRGNRHTFGGLTDAAFRMVPLLEARRDASWPWL